MLNITGSGVNLFAYQGTVQLTNAAGATINFSNGSSLTMNVSTGRSAMFSNSGTVNQVGSALLFNWNDMSNNSFDITNNWFVNSGTWTLTGASLVDFTREGTSGQAGGFNFGYACSNAGTMNIRDASIVNFATLSNTGTMNVGNAEMPCAGNDCTITVPTDAEQRDQRRAERARQRDAGVERR